MMSRKSHARGDGLLALFVSGCSTLKSGSLTPGMTLIKR